MSDTDHQVKKLAHEINVCDHDALLLTLGEISLSDVSPSELSTARELLLSIFSQEEYSVETRMLAIRILLNPKDDGARVILTGIIQSENEADRRLIAEELEHHGEFGIPHLLVLLKDKVNTVRNVAERSLLERTSELQSHGDAELLEILKHPMPLVKSPAARLLGLIQSQNALQPLINMLDADKQWLSRLWAAKALGDLGDHKAADVLSRKMQTDEKNRVRAACVEAIGKLKLPNSVELLTIATRDEDGGVQKIASEQLQISGYTGDLAVDDPFADHPHFAEDDT